jgi:hypothetical protein
MRKRRPFKKFMADAAFKADIAQITREYLAEHGRGSFEIRVTPAGLEAVIRLPDGTDYRGALRAHPSRVVGEPWYVGFLVALDPDVRARDEVLSADYVVPSDGGDYLWPCQLKLNPFPLDKRDGAADLIGTLWVSASDGCGDGQRYVVLARSVDDGAVVATGWVARERGGCRKSSIPFRAG